jgi:hypothetical protein
MPESYPLKVNCRQKKLADCQLFVTWPIVRHQTNSKPFMLIVYLKRLNDFCKSHANARKSLIR